MLGNRLGDHMLDESGSGQRPVVGSWAFGFHKMLGNFPVAEWLLTFHKLLEFELSGWYLWNT
jgi:hypothetical protein